MAEKRIIRVFVSSTFKDMKVERDELVKRVFPRLRRLCEKRGVIWGDVDLRWGVTDEQKAEGQVLPICLEEIQRCRPYFIGVLGERYGWVPDEISQDLIAREPWLAEHKDHSVTELEILHGVLRNPHMNGHAFFYFRDPAYIKTVDPAKRDGFVENSDRQEKLQNLKKRIRESGFPLRENYANPKALAELVERDLTAVIMEFPEATDPLEQEEIEHEAFAESRAQVYVTRAAYFERLNQHAAGGELPLVVLGESGAGKSALLANWVMRYREAHPDTIALIHFIGSTPVSADWPRMAHRILGELQKSLNIELDIPDAPDALRMAFANGLSRAAAKARVILILDGLNQLEDTDGALDLVWLPPMIPENIRLVVSTLPGRALQTVKERAWPTLQVDALTPEERREVVRADLRQQARSLEDAMVDHIISQNAASNPLYLRVLIGELKVHGDAGTLRQRIDHYLEAQSVDALYEKVLTRYEEDYNERQDLVPDAMTAIWAARRGLSETELLEFLGTKTEPLPQATWSPLALAADRSLVSRSGRIGFAHDYLRRAVERRYLKVAAMQQAAHRQLAAYFEKQELSARQIDELPWQYCEAEDWDRVVDLMTDEQFFVAADRQNRWEVRQHWGRIEAGSRFQMLEAYRPLLESVNRRRSAGTSRAVNTDFVWPVSDLLQWSGHPNEAERLREYLTKNYWQIGDQARLIRSLGNQAVMLKDRGDLEGAMALHKLQEQICRHLGDTDVLQSSLGNQGVILQAQGDLDGAMALFKEQERICRKLVNPTDLAMSLRNQGVILHSRGDLDGALALHKEGRRICQQCGDSNGLQQSLLNEANILYSRGDLNGAMAIYKEQERVCRQLTNPDGVQKALGNQGLILYSRGDLSGAMVFHKEQERICLQLGNAPDLARSLGNQSRILYACKDLHGAMALLKEMEQICRQLGDREGLQSSFAGQAVILYDHGDLDGAMALHKEQEQICRQLGNQVGLQLSLGNQALIVRARGDLDGAMALHKEEERICRKLADPGNLQRSLANQAMILEARGDVNSAITVLQETERICRQLGNVEGLARSLAHQSLVAKDLVKRTELADEAYRLATGHGLTALAGQIEPIFHEAVRLRDENGLPNAPIDIPAAHPKANTNEAMRRNIEHQQELGRWKALPAWKRWVTRPPKPPEGI